MPEIVVAPIGRRSQLPRCREERGAGQCINLVDQQDRELRLRHRPLDQRLADILQCLEGAGARLSERHLRGALAARAGVRAFGQPGTPGYSPLLSNA